MTENGTGESEKSGRGQGRAARQIARRRPCQAGQQCCQDAKLSDVAVRSANRFAVDSQFSCNVLV